jgi:hypothetical protein
MLEDQGVLIATVVLYVDDLLIIANEGMIMQMRNQMQKRLRCMVS